MSSRGRSPNAQLTGTDAVTVPEGYKQTEVGVIPEDWDVKSLRDIVDFANGNPHEKNVRSSGRYCLITLDSIDIDGDLKGEHKAIDLLDHSLQRDDLVAILSDIAHGNLLGLCDLIPEDDKYVLNQRVARLRLKTPAVPQFVRLQINRRQDHFKKRGQGTSQRHIYKRDFDALAIPFPQQAEQEAIAEMLSDADALIKSLEQLIAKKRDIKQATMQQLLTRKTRLPGSDSEWNMRQLGDIADIRKGQLITEKDTVAGDVPVIAGGTRPAYFHNRPNRTGKTIAISASGANAGHVSFHRMPIFASDCSTISEGGGYSIEFIYYQLVLNQRAIYGLQTGGAQPHVHPTDLAPMTMMIPDDVSEQVAVAAVLSDMDAEIETLKQRRDKTKAIKQGMMQLLLTGRIRLIEGGKA